MHSVIIKSVCTMYIVERQAMALNIRVVFVFNPGKHLSRIKSIHLHAMMRILL